MAMGFDRLAEAATSTVIATMGGAVTFAPAGGPAIAITGIFKRAFEVVEMEGGLPTTSTRPTVWLQRSQLAADPLQGDQVIVSGETWTIEDAQRESAGTWRCYLVAGLPVGT